MPELEQQAPPQQWQQIGDIDLSPKASATPTPTPKHPPTPSWQAVGDDLDLNPPAPQQSQSTPPLTSSAPQSEGVMPENQPPAPRYSADQLPGATPRLLNLSGATPPPNQQPS